MRIQPFELERWQSVWENKVELNIAESGVFPMSAAELLEEPGARERLLALPLGYPQTNGSEELRGRIAALYPGARAENVLVTTGGAEANFLAVWALVEPGDEVVLMQHNYQQIAGLAEAFGAAVKPWWLRETAAEKPAGEKELRWAPDPQELAGAVTSRTRLIAVCHPNNPTGSVLAEEQMGAVCAAADRVGAWILADEIYRGAEMSGQTTPTFWGRYERVLVTAGLSKAYGLPGLRTGWVVGPPAMVEKLWGYHDYTTIDPTMPGERLASAALEPERREQILARTRRIIRANYPVVAGWVDRHPQQLSLIPPVAGAIACIRCRADTAQLAQDALSQKSVLLCPGEQFGMDGYLRIGFGGHTGELIEALGRIESLIH